MESTFLMTAIACVLLVAQLSVPHRYAFLPLVIAAFHLGNGELIGQFTVVRMLIIAGLVRAAMTGRFKFSMSDALDRYMVAFCVIALLSSFFHESERGSPLVERIGLCLNIAGTYLYGRAFLGDMANFGRFVEALPYILLPLAIFLVAEQVTQKNFYYPLGARSLDVSERQGKFRAKGPFNHAILAGTAGASSIPLVAMLWHRRRKLAKLGIGSAVAITAASASSGPIATTMLGFGALWLWRYRHRMNAVRWAAVAGVVFLHFYMSRPVWFIMDRIDFVGGSTGWHRAKLFDSALTYLDEWWLAGTDYTRHWMHSGVTWSPNHTDITNYYLHLGVIGGIGLSILLVMFIWRSCFRLGGAMRDAEAAGDPRAFAYWCVAACLFAHAVTFFSISYFGQMYALFWIVVGAVPGLAACQAAAKEEEHPGEAACAYPDMSRPDLSHPRTLS